MNIIFYNILFAITGLAISPFMVALVKRYVKEEKVFKKDFFKDVKFDIWIALITPILIIALFYYFRISEQFFIYSILGIILIMAGAVDIKAQIIPNELNFIGFLIGIVLAYLKAWKDVTVSFDMILGMITGATIFLLIALFALIVYKKEGMGLGDVKLMGMLGLFFGFANIIQIFVLSFAIGAIISIILLATKIKKMDDYIAFGPFIVISAIATMFIPASMTVSMIMSLL